jgi:mono/diheme cytochrome c family protein
MNVLVKTLGFSLALILVFTVVSYVLPQMKGEAPVEIEVDVSALTMDSFIAMGKDLYQGKGTCALCHNKLGRAPDLLAFNVGKSSLQRMADSRYQGNAKDVGGYLRESMLDPNIYVVKGFGKKGSNDTESPMPAIDKPPAQLSEIEIDAIIAYLQDKDGNTVTVALPEKTSVSVVATEETAASKTALVQTPEEAIAKFGCATCHAVLETTSPVGPNLNDIGDRLTVDQIREAIITPKAVIAENYPPIMPDFPEMTIKELEILVQFLAQQKTEVQP